MSNENEDVLIEGHEYDGIREYDNPMPRWWINIFIGSVVFSLFYFIHYQLGSGPGIHDDYRAEMEAFAEAEETRLAKAGKMDEKTLKAMAGDVTVVKAGKEVFATNCMACHGARGEGVIGPNLTDKYWIHGDGGMVSIYEVVAEGVLAKGMPAWQRVLSPQQLSQVVAYLGSIRAQNLEGKGPEGQIPSDGNVEQANTESH